MRSTSISQSFGIAPVGRKGVEDLLRVVADAKGKWVPEVARAYLTALGAQLRMLKAQILEFDRMINAAPKSFLKDGLPERTKPWQIWPGFERR